MRRVVPGIAALFAIAISGCTISANLDTGFVQSPPLGTAPKRPALAVQRFVDERPARVYTTGGRGFMTYIPGLPYVAMPFERLDESALKAGEEVGAKMPPFEQYTYPASMARAIAVDLKESGLFEDVVYVGSDSPAAYRYALSGTLRASPLEKDLTSYGLGFVGVLFWPVPIPIGQTWAGVTLDLAVTDTVTGQMVWQRQLKRDYSKWFTFWNSGPTLVYGGVASFDIKQVPYPAGVDRNSLFSWHFEVLRQAMQGVPQEIANALPPDR